MPDSVLGKIALEIGGGVTGGGSPSSLSSGMGGGSNGADKGVKEQVGHLADIRKGSNKIAQVMGGQTRWWGKALKTMGIQVGVAGILKQSQIFTSTLGAMFQIFGAMVDVILAPWLPVIIPLIRWMARGIPKMARASEAAFSWVKDKAWPTAQRWLSNITSGTWWKNLIVNAVKAILPPWLGGTGTGDDPGETAKKGILDKLPTWLGGNGGSLKFPEIPFLSAIADKLGALGPIVASVAGIGLVLAGAKVVRYFTAFAKHIPLIGGIFKPFHILTRFIDEIAHLSIRLVMPGRMLSVWDEIVNTLHAIVGKAKPRVPVRTPRNPMIDAPRGGGGRTPRGGGPADDLRYRPRGAGGGGRFGSPRNPRIFDVDEGLDLGRRVADTSDVWDDALRRAQQLEDMREATYAKKATNIASRGSSPEGKAILKGRKAQAALKTFTDFIDSFIPKMKAAVANGTITQRIKELVRRGISLGSKAFEAAKGTRFAVGVARAGAKFAKWLPGIGAAFIGAEMAYSSEKIRTSDRPWTGEDKSLTGWGKEAGGWAWRAMETAVKFAPGGNPFVAQQMMQKGVVGDIGEKAKQMQREGGAIGEGKLIDYISTLATGTTAAGLSFTGLGAIPGTAAWELQRYKTVGGYNPLTGEFVGGRKDPKTGDLYYGEGDVYSASFDKMKALFELIGQQQQQGTYGQPQLNINIPGLGNGNAVLSQE